MTRLPLKSTKILTRTYLFAAVVKNLASRKTEVEQKKTAAEPKKATVETVKATTEQLNQLNQYDIDLQKHRFEDFYKQLVSWNNNYSQLLGDV